MSDIGRGHAFVVNFNCSAHTIGCVESLLEAGVRHIHVWDNGSMKDDFLRVEGALARFPSVSVTRSEANLGFGTAVNRAVGRVALAPSDFIWIVNPDVRVDAAAFNALAAVLAARGPAIVSPVIRDGDGRIWYAGGRLTPYRVTHLTSPVNGIQATQFITGAAFATQYRTWVSLRGFDEQFFLYWEDVDLSNRARERGISLLVDGDATVTHFVGGSSAGVTVTENVKSPTYYYYMARNRFLLYSHRGSFSSRILVLMRSWKPLGLLIWRGLKQPRGRVRKFLSVAQGIADGLRGVTGPNPRLRPRNR